MPRHLVTTWYGVFLLDTEGKVLAQSLFPRDAEEIARRLDAIRTGALLDEESEVSPGEGGLLVAEPRQLSIPGSDLLPVGTMPPPPPVPASLGFQPDLLRQASLAHAAKAVREALPPDQPVMLLLRAMDLLEKRATQEMELLRYWYGFHFPELAALVDEATELDLIRHTPRRAELVALHPELDPHTEPGRPLSDAEVAAIRDLAADVAAARMAAADMRGVLEGEMVKMAPNVTTLAGALVGARLINLAGSLGRLSRLPSSTVQLLGAERALFLHLSEGAPAPKHGVLFQHPSVHSSPPWLRGRVARTLAGKVSIASRADFAGTHPDGGLGASMREDFLSRVQRLRARHPQPPEGWRERHRQRLRYARRRPERRQGGRRGGERPGGRGDGKWRGRERPPGRRGDRDDRGARGGPEPRPAGKVWRARERR